MNDEAKGIGRKRLSTLVTIVALVVGFIAILVIAVGIYYKTNYPFGLSHCCISGMMLSLKLYATDNAGRYPTGGVTPEASLSLLCRSNYLDAYTIRGFTVPEKTVQTILESGGLLGPDTCGWHYTDGLTVT